MESQMLETTGLTLKDAVEKFILDRASFGSPYTVRWYTGMLRLLTDSFPDAKLTDLGPNDLNRFLIAQRTRQRTRARHDARDNKLSAVTVSGIVRAVRAFFHYCFDQRLIPVHIAAQLKSPRTSPQIKSLTLDQVRELMTDIQSGKWTLAKGSNRGEWRTRNRDIAMLLVQRDTGLPLEGIAELSMPALNLSQGYCIAQYKRGPQKVKLADETREFLSAHIGKRTQGNVFLTEDKNPFAYYGVRQALAMTRKHLQIPPKLPVPTERVEPWLKELRAEIAGNPKPKRNGTWQTYERDFTLFLFALDTGCRVQEMLSLQIESMNLNAGWCDIKHGKGDKDRRVGLLPKTVEMLRAYLKSRETGPVFLTDDGKPLAYDGMRNIMRRMGKRLGTRLNAHKLRHTFGTLFVESGGDVAHLQTLMGHSSIDTTFKYIRAARTKAALQEPTEHSPLNSLWIQDQVK